MNCWMKVHEILNTSACPYVRGRTCVALRAKKKKQLSNRVPETTTTQAVPSLSHARTCVAVRANPPKNRKLSNNHTVRSFALVNDDWIGALCLSINAHKK